MNIDFEEQERILLEVMKFHREQYEKAIKPVLDRWHRLQALKPQTFTITQEQYDLMMDEDKAKQVAEKISETMPAYKVMLK